MKNDTIQTRKWITTCLMALLTFSLVLTGIFFIAPIEAEAAVGDEFTVGGIKYRVLTETEENYTVEVSDAYYAGSNVVIPETVSYNSTTYTVKAIGNSGFYNTSVTSVRIPNTVTEIKNYAFQATRGLTELIIPDSVTKIGESAFYKASGLRSITLSQNITEIARDTFNQCTNLESVIIPANVKTVKQGAFFGCSSLETISVLSTNVTLETGSIPTTVATVYGYEGSTAQTYCTNTGISFSALTVTSIEIPSEFLEQIYLIDGELVPFDITATYNNNMTETVPVKADMVTGFDTDTARENATATVTYGEKTAEFIYTVVLCMDHDYDNGFCTVCDEYQPADITTDKHDINGDGEPDEVYEIGNAGQLYWFADKVNNDWDNFKNANAVLTDDIVVNENVVVDGRLNSDEATVAEFRHWSAVGYLETNGYYGVFDGQGYTVSGLYHNDDYFQTGLFASLYGTARNVGVVNSYLYGDCEVAAISGNARENAEILNCFSINNVLRICDGGGDAGGIVGYTYGDGAVRNCYAAENYFFGSSWESLSGYDISTKNKYSVVFVFENCYYLAESETDIHEGTAFKTAAQFASGEVAYLLGEGWGQTLSGADADEYPVLGGAKVNYGYTTCDPDQIEKIYTNSNVSEEKPGHTGGTVTCEALAICDECGVEYGNYAGHIPNNDDGDCTTDITCSVCGDVTTEGNAEHTGGTAASCTTDQVCTKCGTVLVEALDHDFENQPWTNLGESGHAHQCSRCDEYDEIIPHYSEDEATCTTPKTCDSCGYVMEPSGDHSFTEKIADTAHLKEEASSCVSGAAYWYDCAYCDEISDTLYFTAGAQGAHSFDEDGFCSLCGDGFEAPNYNATRDMNGDGVPDGAYEITKAGHLFWLATLEDYVDGNVFLVNDIVVNDNVLLADGSLNTGAVESFRNWSMIYGIGRGYVFDGNGRSISGLYGVVNGEYGEITFIYDNRGTVKNLTVKDSYFKTSFTTGIIMCNEGVVDNCHSVNNTLVGMGVSGVVGGNYGLVEDCTNSSRILVDCTEAINYIDAAGVVAGNWGTVRDCVNTGKITVNAVLQDDADVYIGGVVAETYFEEYAILPVIENCRNDGAITVTLNGEDADVYYVAFIGGVVCCAEDGSYSNLTNNGDITVTTATDNENIVCVGGVVGSLEGSYNDDDDHPELTDSANMGNITVASFSGYVGGILGGSSIATVEGCVNDGEISVTAITRNITGGVVGSVFEGYVIDCHNTAAIYARVDEEGSIGGVAGIASPGWIENSYNTGDITVNAHPGYIGVGGVSGVVELYSFVINCYNTGDISVNLDGQLIGEDVGGPTISGICAVAENGFVINCYNSGTITAIGHENLYLFYGVAVSPNATTSVVENCYYLNDVATEDGGRTAEQFASGEVSFLLAKDYTYNDEESGWDLSVDGDVWGQLIGTDALPMLKSNDKVYALSHCAGNATLYTNDASKTYILTKHDAVESTCQAQGSSAYWVCSVCGKVWADENCTVETTVADSVLPLGEHDFSDEWDYKDEQGHAYRCLTPGCSEHSELQPHEEGAAATEDDPQLCTECGFVITPAIGHIHHTSSGEYGYDASGHWFKCVGCETERLNPAGHSFDNDCDVDCICGYQRTIEHNYTELKFNETHHWYACSVCGTEQSGSRIAHNGGVATCEVKAICSCGQSYGGYGSHTFGQWQEEISATCVATGTKAHKTCSTCEKHFEEDGVTVIDDLTIAIDEYNHDMATEWTGVEDGHYHKCRRTGCDYHTAMEDHEPDRAEATESEPVKCSVCEYIIIPAMGHIDHTSSGIYGYDENGHWFKCVGCETEKVSPAGHSFDNDCDTDCACGYVRTVAHDFTGAWQKDASGHWHVCMKNGCSVTDTKQNHISAGAAIETDPEVCSICGWQIAPALGHTTHTPEAEWQKNETHHWHECTGCDGQELDKAAHNDGNNDGSCDACGYAMSVTPPPHTHSHGSTWVTDANEHWNECVCGDKANVAPHVDVNGDEKCDVCEYAMPTDESETETETETEIESDTEDESNTEPESESETELESESDTELDTESESESDSETETDGSSIKPTDSDKKDGLSGGAIAGIVIGSVAVVGIGGFALLWFVIKKKTFADLIAIFKKK